MQETMAMAPARQTCEAVVPLGLRAGQTFQVMVGNRAMQLTVPPGAVPNRRIRFTLPNVVARGTSPRHARAAASAAAGLMPLVGLEAESKESKEFSLPVAQPLSMSGRALLSGALLDAAEAEAKAQDAAVPIAVAALPAAAAAAVDPLLQVRRGGSHGIGIRTLSWGRGYGAACC